MPLMISSPVFENEGNIPSKYTCDKDGINPPLEINGVPESAKSLVLIMDDPDIPDSIKHSRGIEVFDHWIVFNISSDTRKIEEGKEPKGVNGLNSRGQNKYTAPCPPDREHRYFFKIYALDMKLDLPLGSTKEEVEEAMRGHILAQAKLVGKYQRNR